MRREKIALSGCEYHIFIERAHDKHECQTYALWGYLSNLLKDVCLTRRTN